MIELARDLYVEEARIRFYGIRLSTRMTVIRLSGGRLLLHSPTPLTARVRSELDLLGKVACVVSPNKIHNQFIGHYQHVYPRARCFASPGLPERRPDLRFDGVLRDRPEPEWEAELDQAGIAGNQFFQEIVFLHRASRTLIVSDLVENFDAHTTTRLGRALAWLVGVRGRPVASPEHRWYTDDAEAATRSLERVGSWDFENIVLAHGRLVRGDGRAVFEEVSRRLVDVARRRGPVRRRLFAWLARRQSGGQTREAREGLDQKGRGR